MSTGRWLTPNAPPEHKFYVRKVFIPADIRFLAPISGALVELTYPSAWEEDGDLTPEQTAEIFSGIYQQFLPFDNEPPEWETPDEADGQPTQPWYESLSDWIIQGFLAVTFTPAAAIVYEATVPKLRVAFRTGNLGALFRVLINGVEVWTGDSYAPITDLIDNVFDTSALTPPYTVRIEHNGVGPNINGTEAKLEFIRGEVVNQLVQTILRGDPGGCGVQWSTDDGGTWNTIDLASCITDLANDAILQAITDGIIAPGQVQQPPQTRPDPLTCVTYHVRLTPGAQWHCPNPVSAGDTVLVSNAKGGWSVGELAWYCPDGKRYLAGICDESLETHVSGDLLNPGAFHMAIVGLAGATYFDPFTLYTIPFGDDGELFLTANTGLTGTPSGEVSFDVEVCSAEPWCQHFDFTASDGGWQPVNAGGTDFAVYSAGVGWTSIYNHNGLNVTETRIVRTFTSINFKLLEFVFEFDTTAGVSTYNVFADSTFFTNSASIGSGSGQTLDQTVDLDGHTSIRGDLAKAASGGGNIVITGVTVRGTGDNPFGTSNC